MEILDFKVIEDATEKAIEVINCVVRLVREMSKSIGG